MAKQKRPKRTSRVRKPDLTKVDSKQTANIGVGRFFPSYLWSKIRPGVIAWDGVNTFVGNKYLDFITNIATFITEYTSSFLGALDPVNMKDLDTTQQTNFRESVFYGADLLHSCGSQGFMRKANKLLTESDASGYWTQESWDSFASGVENRQMSVPIASLNLALAENVGWILNLPYDKTNLPLSISYKYTTVETLANAKTVRDGLLSRAAGARIHAKKFGLPMIPLTKELLQNCFRIIPFGSNEWLYHYATDLLKVDVGSVETDHCLSSPTGVQFESNLTTSYTGVYVLWGGDNPSDLWAFAPMHGNIYDATNNVIGALTFGTVPDDKSSVLHCAQNDVVLTSLANSGINKTAPLSGGYYGATQFIGGGLADPHIPYNFPMMHLNPDAYWKTGVAYDVWQDTRRVLFQYMLKQQYPFGGGDARRTPTENTT